MKKIIIILCLFIITGCTADVELHITSSTLENIVTISEDVETLENMNTINDQEDHTITRKGYAFSIAQFENDFNVERQLLNQNDRYAYQYYQKLNIKNEVSKSMFYDCYDEITITTGKNITITTSDDFKCFEKYGYLDDVKLKITSSYEFVSTNADIWGDGAYYWFINQEDTNRPIVLELKQPKTTSNTKAFVIVTISILFIVGIFLYYKKFYKRGY